MHLLIPFAVPWSEAGRQAAATLAAAALAVLLPAAWIGGPRDEADECSLSPPHERALARALGLAGGSGLLPWAALQAAADGVDVADLAWGLLTPGALAPGHRTGQPDRPGAAALDETTRVPCSTPCCRFSPATASCCAGARRCAGTPRTKAWPAWPRRRWTASSAATWTPGWAATPQRAACGVCKRSADAAAHAPLNEQREAQGLLPVNSFWLSGCGVAQEAVPGTPCSVDERLRGPALAEDWAAWVKAWRHAGRRPGGRDAGRCAGAARRCS
jgi:hypothetical protein